MRSLRLSAPGLVVLIVSALLLSSCQWKPTPAQANWKVLAGGNVTGKPIVVSGGLNWKFQLPCAAFVFGSLAVGP
jgi:hypothetical protein